MELVDEFVSLVLLAFLSFPFLSFPFFFFFFFVCLIVDYFEIFRQIVSHCNKEMLFVMSFVCNKWRCSVAIDGVLRMVIVVS
jgi:hypothetical protein